MNRQLPYGWVRKVDRTGRRCYVDNMARPPRAIWTHPYDDDQYLFDHPEVREMLGKDLTVKMLTLDRSVPDITQYILREEPFATHVGSGGNIFRGTYRHRNPTTQRTEDIKVAIKRLKGTREDYAKIEKRLDREISTWRHLRHPNVTELLGIATLNPDLPPGLVSRWVQRNKFLEYIGRHPELKRSKAIEISSGVQFLHKNNIVHGDLKVNNVLISDDGQAQITDFGVACILDVQGYTTSESAPRNIRYVAPELMPINPAQEDDKRPHPTLESDIYSLAILLLQLFHGPDNNLQRGLPYNHVPYNARAADYPLVKLIHEGVRPIRRNYRVMHDTHWNMMERCWASNPFKRPVINEVLEAL